MTETPSLSPRGPVSEVLLDALAGEPGALPDPPPFADDPLDGDDFHLALYACYELHYRGLAGVSERWEWEPGLLAFRAELEAAFEARLEEAVGPEERAAPEDVPQVLRDLVENDDGPPVSRFLETRGTLDQFREFAMHRSAYQLKEADPHSWAIPRLDGPAKAALVEIQADEYGGGRAHRVHATLFADSMRALGLDSTYGAYVDLLPGVTLATVNLMSLLGLHRRRRGAVVGHLAAFEMSSPLPNRRYGNGLRRLGLDSEEAVGFYDEHVEADSVHENIAAYDMAGGLARQDPALAGEIVWGCRALLAGDARFGDHVLPRWERGETTLLTAVPAPASA